jgi:hypothetical protein
MERIKKNLKASHDRKKRYANRDIAFIDFKVGEHVFLKMNSKRSLLRLGSCLKLAVRYCGPFEILEKIGSVAYMFDFTTSMRVHNLFHISLLKKYVPYSNHVIDWNVIQVEHERDFRVEPVPILERKV